MSDDNNRERSEAKTRKRRARHEGSVERRGKRWYGRIRREDGSRPWIPLGTGISRRKAEEMLAALGERGDETGQLGALIDRLRSRMAPRASRAAASETVKTVRELVDDWTSGALFQRYGAVNRLRPIASAKINAWTLAKYALEVPTRGSRGVRFGDLPVPSVTAEDVGRIMAALPRHHAAQTRVHMYQRLRRIFDLAEYPCRLREENTNPVKRYMRPERDEEKLYCYLYPAEVLALLGSPKIPLGRRVLYAVATYTGLRKSSLYALRWKGIDFEHGTISALRVKGKHHVEAGEHEVETSGRPILSRGDPSLMVLVKAWWEHCKKPGAHMRVVRDVGLERNHDEAGVLRKDLRRVGVTREILFSDAPNVQALRFHDFRSTFCTWARRAGKSDVWIAERTGHRLTGAMIDRYTRQAQTLEDLDYEPFPDISVAIPELAAASTAPSNARTRSPNAPSTRREEGAGPASAGSTGASDPKAKAVAALLLRAAELGRLGHVEACAALSRTAQELLAARGAT